MSEDRIVKEGFKVDRQNPERLKEFEGFGERRAAYKLQRSADKATLVSLSCALGGILDEARVRVGHPGSFGWLRRRDLDCPNGCCHAYEKPDGSMYIMDSKLPLVVCEVVQAP